MARKAKSTDSEHSDQVDPARIPDYSKKPKPVLDNTMAGYAEKVKQDWKNRGK